MEALLTLVALLGFAIGSLLTIIVYRIPAGLSLRAPGWQCRSCHAPIRARHAVPLVGWLLLRGRCAQCTAPISVRYPAIELLTGSLFVGVTLRLQHLHQLPATPAFLYLVAAGVALAFIDFDVQRLPNVIVLPSYPALALLLTMSALWQHDGHALLRAAEGGAALYAFYFLLVLIYPAGMGFGDVKLAGVQGACLAYLSWSTLLIGAFAGFLLGGLAGATILAIGRGSRKTAIPFGPFIIAGSMVAIFAAPEITAAYIHLLARG
jgi:leader peptidase (prepilin peptidase)/N-methyltransferase